MSDFLKKIAPVAGVLGAAALGSYLFPETTFSMTGGMLGSMGGAGANGALTATDLMAQPYMTDAGGLGSIFSNPTVLSSGILAGTSLISGLFGSDSDMSEYQTASLAEQQRQFDAELALKQAQLAQALEIAKIQSAAGGGASNAASITAKTNRDIARANAIGNATSMKGEALQIPLKAMENQINAAQTTGIESGRFFNALMQGLQAPAMKRA